MTERDRREGTGETRDNVRDDLDEASKGRRKDATRMMASRSMRRLPSTDCSASTLCGGSRSMMVGVAMAMVPLAL